MLTKGKCLLLQNQQYLKKKMETIMSEKHVYYITEPLKGLISTVIADSGHRNLFFLIKSAREKMVLCKGQNNKS